MNEFPSAEEMLEIHEAGEIGPLVELVLQPLVGLAFSDMGRAVDMAWLGFGKEIEVVRDWPRPGRKELIAPHRLHLQCPFRLEGPEGTVTTSEDIYQAAQQQEMDGSNDENQGEEQGITLYDIRLETFWNTIHSSRAKPVVEAVSSDRHGGLFIKMTGSHQLTVSPTVAQIQEHWRYFQIGAEEHFVFLES